MAKLKVSMELNAGRVGVPLHKLAEVADEFEKLFRYLAEDLGVSSGTGDWLASNFENGSVRYVVELAKPVDESVVPKYNAFLSSMADYAESKIDLDSRITTKTLKQFVTAGKVLDQTERISLGLYANGGPVTEWKPVAKRNALELERLLQTPIKYEGSIQGRTVTWFKGSDYFDLRDLVFGQIVKCVYNKDLYAKISDAYDDREAVVHVIGTISSNKLEKRPIEIAVRDIRSYRPLSNDEFKRLYGIAPDLTGDMSTEEFLERVRADGEA